MTLLTTDAISTRSVQCTSRLPLVEGAEDLQISDHPKLRNAATPEFIRSRASTSYVNLKPGDARSLAQ